MLQSAKIWSKIGHRLRSGCPGAFPGNELAPIGEYRFIPYALIQQESIGQTKQCIGCRDLRLLSDAALYVFC